MIATLLFTSCKKEKVAEPVVAVEKKIVKIDYTYEGAPSSNETYSYDDKGRIAVYTYDMEEETFEYIGDHSVKVTRRDKTTNAITAIMEAELNNRGAITDMTFKSANGVTAEHYTFSYNADGNMVKRKSENLGGNSTWEHEYQIENGNPVSAKIWVNGIHQYNHEYSYDITRQLTLPETSYYFWLSSSLFGKPWKNVRTGYKSILVSNGNLNAHTIYTNQFDASGRLVKQDLSFVVAGKKGSYSFIYQ